MNFVKSIVAKIEAMVHSAMDAAVAHMGILKSPRGIVEVSVGALVVAIIIDLVFGNIGVAGKVFTVIKDGGLALVVLILGAFFVYANKSSS